MGIENLMMTINRVPKIELDTGTDWTAVFTAVGTSLATISLIVMTTWYTAYSFRKTIKSQKSLADAQETSRIAHSKAEAVARSRQNWINSLRSEISHLLSVTHEIYSLAYDVKALRIQGEAAEAIQESWREHREKSDRFYAFVAKARFHVSNIQLHLNPGESDSRELQKQIDLLVANAYENKRIADQVDEIIKISQVILKKEWVRVKDMA